MRIRWFSPDGQRIAEILNGFNASAPRSHVDQRRVKAVVETLFCLKSSNLEVYSMKRAGLFIAFSFRCLDIFIKRKLISSLTAETVITLVQHARC